MFGNIFKERSKELEARNVEIQKRANELNKEVQLLAREYQANRVRLDLLKELEKEFGEKDGAKNTLQK